MCIALVAGFTGLSLTKGVASQPPLTRKISVAISAIALGGGIWSMHFVAMLGLQLPFLFYYDAVITLISALVAILVVGCALLILHFYPRTTVTVTVAGAIVGVGVLAMHYIGMSGLQMCRVVYTPAGIAIAVVASCALNIGAFRVAYGARETRNILFGTVCFGLSVFIVHFVAIAGTGFVAVESTHEIGPLIGNEVLAIGVVLTSFVLCGAFLLTGVTFLAPVPTPAPDPSAAVEAVTPPPAPPVGHRIPYEQNGKSMFIDPADVAVLRAEGHYSVIYSASAKMFCPWSITEAERRLAGGPFIKCHRSYLINPDHIVLFERMKDNGICHVLANGKEIGVPVSRARLKPLRDALGL